jgi:hypothetical protein
MRALACEGSHVFHIARGRQVGRLVVIIDTNESRQRFYLGHTAAVVALSVVEVDRLWLQAGAPKSVRRVLEQLRNDSEQNFRRSDSYGG